MINIIVTGGAGFIGSNFIRKLLKRKIYKILNVDKLTYAGNKDNLKKFHNFKNYNFKKIDINSKKLIKTFNDFEPDILINFAAETHVDRSIDSAKKFLITNILGTQNLLEISKNYCQKKNNKKFKFIHISTDEVFGDLNNKNKKFNIKTNYNPSSPYSASKASSDHLVRAWNRTYNLNTIIINCSNNYGPYQYPEKLIPHAIISLIKKKKIPIYGNGNQIRDWLFVDDHIEAIEKVIKKGKIGKTYLIGGNNEIKNIFLVKKIIQIYYGLKQKKIKNFKKYIKFVKDRPGHDKKYSVDTSKTANEIKWKPKKNINEGLRFTINWYLNNEQWINNLIKKNFKLKRIGKLKK